MKRFNINNFMKKQTSDNEKDIKVNGEASASTEEFVPEMADDNMTVEAEAGDNVSVEPTLEEQIAVWRDKYLRLQAEFDNFRKRTCGAWLGGCMEGYTSHPR